MQYQQSSNQFQELMNQCRTVLVRGQVEGKALVSYSPGETDQVMVVQTLQGNVAVFISTASGFEPVFVFKRSGEVRLYVASWFWQTELENWTAQIARLQEGRARRDAALRGNAPRCPFYNCIRQFFACAQEQGLNTKDDAAMREALGGYFNIQLDTRKEMTGSMWLEAASAVRIRALAW